MKNNIYLFLRGERPFYPSSFRAACKYTRTHSFIANEQKKKREKRRRHTKNETDCIAMPSDMIVWVMCDSHFNHWCRCCCHCRCILWKKFCAHLRSHTFYEFEHFGCFVVALSLFVLVLFFLLSFAIFYLLICLASFVSLFWPLPSLPLCNSILIWMSVVPIIIIIIILRLKQFERCVVKVFRIDSLMH